MTVTSPTRPAAVEVHRETYRGTEFVIRHHPAYQLNGSTWGDYHTLSFDKGSPKVAGDLPTVIKKARAEIDRRHTDAELRPKLTQLIGTQPGKDLVPVGRPVELGDVLYVWAMGRYRRGLVTKVARARATVSYTTASSQGVIYHKAEKFEELSRPAEPGETRAEPKPVTPAEPDAASPDDNERIWFYPRSNLTVRHANRGDHRAICNGSIRAAAHEFHGKEYETASEWAHLSWVHKCTGCVGKLAKRRAEAEAR